MKKSSPLPHFRRASLYIGTSAALLAASMLSVSADDYEFDIAQGETVLRSDSLHDFGLEPPESSLLKMGEGTLILTGSNDYSWGTNIYAGTLNLQGSTAAITHPDGDTYVFGGATLNALDGASIETFSLFIGVAMEDQARANVTLSGKGTSVETTEGITVGFSASGQLTISDQAEMRGLYLMVGLGLPLGGEGEEEAPPTGSALVTGAGSILSVENIVVGFGGTGNLTIRDGALAESTNGGVGIGFYEGDSDGQENPLGSVIIDGPNSTWMITRDPEQDYSESNGNLLVGAGGKGYLTISNGGLLTSYSASVAKPEEEQINQDGEGHILITGAGSKWINGEDSNESHYTNGRLLLGESGTATLEIREGGVLENWGHAGIGTLRYALVPIEGGSFEFVEREGFGHVLVSGSGSKWWNKEDVTVYNGSITLANNGLLRIEGAGEAPGILPFSVEHGGAGELEMPIGPQGPHSPLGVLYLTQAEGVVATLNIGSAPGNTPTAPGHLEALKISTDVLHFAPPTPPEEPSALFARINFNHTSDAYTFKTPITGKIEVNQYAGTTILTGTSDYLGGTKVYGGTLLVDGHITGLVDVQGGTLGGSGFIDGNVLNNAFVHPGNASQLTISGLYTQSESGAYVVEFSKAGHDSLLVGGAKLDGNLLYGFKGGFAPKTGKSYTILSLRSIQPFSVDEGIGAIAGEFDKIVGMNPTILKPKAIYTETDVFLQFSQGKFAGVNGLTPNQRAVARALDQIVGKKGTKGLINELNGIPLTQLPDVFSLLSPEQFAIIFESGFATAQINFGNLERRMDDLRSGVTGFSANGLALTNSHGSLNYEGVPLGTGERGGLTPLTLAGWDGKSIVGKQTVAPVIESDSRLGFFATGTGEWGDVENTSQAHGSDFTTGGITLGADYRFSENFAVGITGGYVNTSSNLYDGGKVDLNGGKLGLYATAFSNGFFVDATVGGGYNSYDTKRSTLGGNARGSTEGLEFTSMLGTGYEIEAGGFKFGPVASLQYAYIGIDGFNEHGSSAPLHIASQGQNSLKSAVGLKASYEWLVGGVRIKPEVRAQWLHEYLDSTVAVESNFTAGDSFLVHGPKIGRDGLLLDAGASMQFENGVSVFAYYTGELARTNYISNSVNGGVRIAF